MNEEFHDLIEQDIWHYLRDNKLAVWDEQFHEFIKNVRKQL